MRLILFDAFLAVCIATITAETLSDDNSSDASIFEEELPQDLLWNDLETHLLSADYDISNVDLFAPKDISSSTTDLASSRLDAPSCLLNGNDQPLLRRARARRDGETGASSCDANSKPWYPPGQPTGPDQLDETLWKEFYGSPGDNEPEPEEPSTLIPILKDPKEINQNCLPEFPKHLCCVQRGPLEGEYLTRMIYTRMYQCEIGTEYISFFTISFFTHRFSPLALVTFDLDRHLLK